MIRIPVVDDERPLLRAPRINLTARRYEVLTADAVRAKLHDAAKTEL